MCSETTSYIQALTSTWMLIKWASDTNCQNYSQEEYRSQRPSGSPSILPRRSVSVWSGSRLLQSIRPMLSLRSQQILAIQKGWPNSSPPANVATNSPTCTHANCLAILPLQYTILSSSIFSNDRWWDVDTENPTPIFHVRGYWSGQYLTRWLSKIVC